MARLYEALERAEQEVEGLAVVPQPGREAAGEKPGRMREKLIPVYQNVLRELAGDCRAICFVGLGEQDAVSMLLREFAFLIAQMGGKRVLLLELSEGEGAQFRHFGVKCKGTFEGLLNGDQSMEDAIHTTIRPGLSLGRLANSGSGARSVLSHHEFPELMEQLRRNFDFILYGATATTDQTDAAMLASKSDGAVLILESGKTRWQVAKSLCAALDAMGGNVVGAVLNNRRHYIPKAIYRWL